MNRFKLVQELVEESGLERVEEWAQVLALALDPELVQARGRVLALVLDLEWVAESAQAEGQVQDWEFLAGWVEESD